MQPTQAVKIAGTTGTTCAFTGGNALDSQPAAGQLILSILSMGSGVINSAPTGFVQDAQFGSGGANVEAWTKVATGSEGTEFSFSRSDGTIQFEAMLIVLPEGAEFLLGSGAADSSATSLEVGPVNVPAQDSISLTGLATSTATNMTSPAVSDDYVIPGSSQARAHHALKEDVGSGNTEVTWSWTNSVTVQAGLVAYGAAGAPAPTKARSQAVLIG